jgi:hypothetical protein
MNVILFNLHWKYPQQQEQQKSERAKILRPGDISFLLITAVWFDSQLLDTSYIREECIHYTWTVRLGRFLKDYARYYFNLGSTDWQNVLRSQTGGESSSHAINVYDETRM